MNIVIPPHTLLRAEERGASCDEIIDTLQNGKSIPAKRERLAKTKVFTFDTTRNNKYYSQKKLEVYYVTDNTSIITVTVYVFYGSFQ